MNEGRYSLRAALTASPDKVKWWALAVLGVVGAALGLEPSLFETVGVGVAIERTLDLFYVAPVKKANEDNFVRALVAGHDERGQARPIRAGP